MNQQHQSGRKQQDGGQGDEDEEYVADEDQVNENVE